MPVNHRLGVNIKKVLEQINIGLLQPLGAAKNDNLNNLDLTMHVHVGHPIKLPHLVSQPSNNIQ